MLSSNYLWFDTADWYPYGGPLYTAFAGATASNYGKPSPYKMATANASGSSAASASATRIPFTPTPWHPLSANYQWFDVVEYYPPGGAAGQLGLAYSPATPGPDRPQRCRDRDRHLDRDGHGPSQLQGHRRTHRVIFGDRPAVRHSIASGPIAGSSTATAAGTVSITSPALNWHILGERSRNSLPLSHRQLNWLLHSSRRRKTPPYLTGTLTDTSTATATGIRIAIGAGASTGASTANATGIRVAHAVGPLTGTSTATAHWVNAKRATGALTGANIAQAIPITRVAGELSGTSTAAAAATGCTRALLPPRPRLPRPRP